jgi:molybdenum cofactor biosynthesis enzyme MoaA
MTSRVAANENWLTLRLLLTEQCNFRCTFCHNEGQGSKSEQSSLTGRELERLISVGKEHGLRQLKFSGGEPTLHPLLTSFLEIAGSDPSIDCSVITNASDTSSIERVSDQSNFRVSVNVPTVDPNEFGRLTGGALDVVLTNVRRLREQGRTVDINSYLPGNRVDNRRLTGLLDLAGELGSTLKILVPAEAGNDPSYDATEIALLAAGLSLVGKTDFDSTYLFDQTTIRIVYPWCPTSCKATNNRYRSIRMSAKGNLVPCFGDSRQEVPCPLGTEIEIRSAFQEALARTGVQCPQLSTLLSLVHRTTGERFEHE